MGGYACPSSTQCPTGSAVPQGCPAGTFNPTEGVELCPLCPAGAYCPGNSTFPAECPLRFFCPQGTDAPSICPNGTYGAAINLTKASECAACPPGYFCVDGTITGECAPGYFCRSGQGSPTPEHYLPGLSDDPASQLSYLIEQNGGQCPPGHFCYAGTFDPFPCENSTVRLATHGASPDDCGPCPAGYMCFDGDPVPDPCEPGYYCPIGETRIPCPVGHYNEFYSMSMPDDCILCPAGSFCNATAISDPAEWPCPSSEYCLNGTLDPLPCPAGTYRDELNAESMDACYECPGGFYCPRETDVYYSCSERNYCPPGSSNTTACPAGHYCPVNSLEPLLCPENYFCPISTAVPEPCYRGTYCPNGTTYPNLCSLGYKAIDESNFTLAVLSYESEACEACPPGEYGDSEDRLSCEMCTPGYVCLGATTTPTPTLDDHRGYICPKGAYCPEGSFEEVKCPVGTFQPNFGESNSSSCLNCEPGTYQDEEGQDSCYQCSSSSSSEEAATTCVCVGKNRNFQPDDGWCVCIPGYEFVNSDLTVSTEADGTIDCQPIVYDRCLDSQSRSVSGLCVNEASYCDVICGVDVRGTFIEDVGSCECNGLENLEEICDEDCLESQKSVTCNDGSLVIYDPLTDTSEHISIDSMEIQGSLDCSSKNSAVFSIGASTSGFEGQFGAGSLLDSGASGVRRVPSTNWITNRSNNNMSSHLFSSQIGVLHRSVQTSNITKISNPLVCVKEGDSILFAVSNENYPVYDKDLLINTNPNFDYGSFRDLASKAASSLTISSFAVTLHNSGVYGFKMSSQPEQLLVVSVMPPNVNCSTDAQFVPFSRTNLITMGITAEDEIVLSPDWNLIFGLTSGMLLVILILIGFMYYFRKRAWATHHNIISTARKMNMSGGPPTTKGGFVTRSKLAMKSPVKSTTNASDSNMEILDSEVNRPITGAISFFMDDVESAALAKESNAIEFDDDMMVPELANHMQKNHDTIDRQMHIQKDILNELKDGLKNDLDGLKNLLVSASSEFTSSMSKSKKMAAMWWKLKSDMTARAVYEIAFQSGQSRIMNVFSRLQQLLREGHAVTTDMIIRQIVDNAAECYEQRRPLTDIRSTVLDELTAELASTHHIIESIMIPAVIDEESRYKNAEKSFLLMIKNNGVTVPTSILNGIQRCSDVDADTDDSVKIFTRKLKIIAGQIPVVASALASSQEELGRVLVNSLEVGNPDLGEKEKSMQHANITSRLLAIIEMFTFLEHVEDEAVPSLSTCISSACICRAELELLLDNMLKNDEKKSSRKGHHRRHSPNKSSARAIGSDNESGHSSDNDNYSGSDGESASDSGYSSDESGRKRRGSQMFIKAQTEVQINNNLSDAQKSELLGTVDQDVAIVDNIINVERQHKDDMMKHLLEESMGSSDGDLDDMACRHDKEKQDLADKIKSEHNRRLNSIMNTESATLNFEDEDAVQESMVHTFASTKYAIIMRRHAAWCRIRFSALHDEYEKKRVDRFGVFVKEIQVDDHNCVNSNIVLSSQMSVKLENDVEVINTEERNALQLLYDGLRQSRFKLEECHDHLSEAWVADWKSVKLANEIAQLKEETVTDFDKMKNEINKHAQFAKECAVTRQSLTSALMTKRISRFDETIRKPILEALDEEATLQLQITEDESKDNFHVLAVVEQQVEKMLELSTAWGPLVDNRLLQDKLHERMITALHSFHDGVNRIAVNEDNLKMEAAEMALFSKVSKMNVDEHAVAKVIFDFRTVEKDKSEALANQMRNKQQDEILNEKDRQAQSILDYERELASATEINAFRHVSLCVSSDESRLKSLRVVGEAMLVKKEYLLAECAKKQVPEYIKTMLAHQIDSEIQREECELNAAYGFISCDILNTQRHAASITEGIVPGTTLAKSNLTYSYNKGVYLYHESMGAEIARVFNKALLIDDSFREYEGNRLIQLEASFESLSAIENDISETTADTMRDVMAYCRQELKSLEKNMSLMLKQKQNNQEIMHLSIQCKQSEYEGVQMDMAMSYKEDRDDLQSQLTKANESAVLISGALLNFDQRAAAATSLAYSDFCEHMFDEFQEFLRRQAGLEKKEDILSLKRNEKQQELESLEIVLSQERENKLNALIHSQQERRQEWVEEAWLDDRNAHGLEAHLRARNEAAHEKLRKSFSLRRAAREKVLVAEGMSTYDARLRAEVELKEYEERKMKKLASMLNIMEEKSRRDIRNDNSEKTRVASKRFELLKECIPRGFREFELRERAELKKKSEVDMQDIAKRLLLEEGTEIERDLALDKLSQNYSEDLQCLTTSQNNLLPIIIQALEAEAVEETARVKLRGSNCVDDEELIKNLVQQSKDAFVNGLDNLEESKRQDIHDNIADLINSRRSVLEEEGMSADDALTVAEEDLAPERQRRESALGADIHRVRQRLEEAINRVAEDRLLEIGHNYELAMNGLELSFKVKKAVHKNSLKKRLQQRKTRRKQELLAQGISNVEEALSVEFSGGKELVEEMEDRLNKELVEASKCQSDKAKASEFVGVHHSFDSTDERESSNLRKTLLKEELLHARTGFEQFYNSIAKALDSTNTGAGGIEKEIAQLREKYEMEIHALQSKMRASQKESELRGPDDESVKVNAVLQLEGIRKEHDAAEIKLKDDILHQHKLSMARMKERLAKKKAILLGKDNLTPMDRARIDTDSQLEEQEQTEKLKNQYEEDKCEQVQALVAQHTLIRAKLQKAIDSGDVTELYETEIRMKKGELAAAISNAILSERARQLQQASSAGLLKENAVLQLEGIRKEHDVAVIKLKEDILHQHKLSMARMKERLATKKAILLGKDNLTPMDRARIVAELQLEEQEQAEKLSKENAAEKEKQLAALLAEQARIQAQICKVVQENEALQLSADGQEAALLANEAIKVRNEEESRRRELMRIQQSHRDAVEKAEDVLTARRTKGEGQLKNRLAEKRAKKDKELKQQEEEALAELEIKQKEEHEEREKLRQAKITWSERIAEAAMAAKEMGLDIRGKEDFCFSETLGKKLVPETHYSEAAAVIMKERHALEMKTLLDAHYESRIAAIKKAVEDVLQEKAAARIELVDSLNSKKTTDDFIALSLSDLDDTFNKKRIEAEEGAVMMMEREHVASQVALRQQQLEEISSVISLYTDFDSMTKLRTLTNKSRAEEILAYRASLETENREREDKIHREREDRELMIREEHAKSLEKMKAEFETKKKEDERALELSRQQLENDNETKTLMMNEKRKTMIKTKFEQAEAEKKQALERTRLTQRSSMLARRDAQRNRRAGGLIDIGVNQLRQLTTTLEETPMSGQNSNQESKVDVMKERKNSVDYVSDKQGSSGMLLQSMRQIEEKLNHIDRVMRTLDTAGQGAGVQQTLSAPVGVFFDGGNPQQGEELRQTLPEKLSVQEKARIQFGKRLAEMVGIKNLAIVAAGSLPPSQLSNNSFKNSYHFNASANTLYIHISRLSSSGDFGLVVIHALSHIKINPDDLSNDSDPVFMNEFYRNLRILSQDLYKYSQTKKVESATTHSSSHKLSVRQLAAIGRSPSMSSDGFNEAERRRGGAITSGQQYFGADSMHERVKQYAQECGIPTEFLERYVEERKETSKEEDEN